MISTSGKRYMRHARGSRFMVFVKKQGQVLMIEKSYVDEQYVDNQPMINRYEFLVKPKRP